MLDATTIPPTTLIKHPTWCHSHGAEGDLQKVQRLLLTREAPAESDEEHVGRHLQLDCGAFAWTVRTAVRQYFEEFQGAIVESEPHIWIEVNDHNYMSLPTEAYFTLDEARHFVKMLEEGIGAIERDRTHPRL